MPTTWTASVGINLTEMRCGKCGAVFAMDEVLREERERTGDAFYCPNGHSRGYIETNEMKLRKQLTTEMRNRSEAEQKQREAEEKLLKIEKRIAKGVCPCCKRTFTNMQRHMKTKHPEMGLVTSGK